MIPIARILLVILPLLLCQSAWAVRVADSITSVGLGVFAPSKLLLDPSDSNRLYIVTGGTEDAGLSKLHHVLKSDFSDVAPPIEIGASATGVVTLGNYVLIAARGSDQIVVVDINSWTLTDRFATQNQPYGIVSLPENRFAISHTGAGSVSVLELIDGKLLHLTTKSIGGVLFGITRSDDGQHVYVVDNTSSQVLRLDASDLSIVDTYPLSDQPAFDLVATTDRVFALGREGYLFAIDITSGNVRDIDLAELLQLDRSSLPLRGIEPIFPLLLPNGQLLVVNNRQNSLILDIESRDNNQEYNYLPVHQLSAGVHAVFQDPPENNIIITRTSTNRIIEHDRSSNAFLLPAINRPTGSFVKQMAVGTDTIAYVTTDKTMHLISQSARMAGVTDRSSDITGQWIHISRSASGQYIGIAESLDGFRLQAIDQSGIVTATYTLESKNPFVIETGCSEVLVIDRLFGTVERIVNFPASPTGTLVSVTNRPRAAACDSDGNWYLIHDTWPDVGISKNAAGSNEWIFSPSPFSTSWLSDIDTHGNDVYAISFEGELGKLDSNLDLLNSHKPLSVGVNNLDTSNSSFFWSTSVGGSSVIKYSADTLRPVGQISIPNALSFYENADESLWVATPTELHFFNDSSTDAYSLAAIAIEQPPDHSTISGAASTSITWSISDSSVVDQWWVYVSSEFSTANLLNSGPLPASTRHIEVDLSDHSGQLFVTVYGRVSGKWLYDRTSYTVQETAVRPAILTPSPGSELSGSSVQLEWSTGSDNIDAYWLYAGSTQGASNYHNSGNLNASTSGFVNNLPTDGTTVYIRLWYRENSNTQSSWRYVDYQFIAAASAAVPELVYPESTTLLSGSEEIRWSNQGLPATTQFWLFVGSTPGGSQYYASKGATSSLSEVATGIQTNGQSVWIRLWYRFNSQDSWKFFDSQFTSMLSGPRIVEPEAGSTISNTSITVSWTADEADIQDWWLFLGTSIGSRTIYHSGLLPASTISTNIQNIPLTGDPVYMRLWYRLNEETDWRWIDEIYSTLNIN